MTISSLILIIIGIIGIINFIIDYRKKTLRWWDYVAVTVCALFIAEAILYMYI